MNDVAGQFNIGGMEALIAFGALIVGLLTGLITSMLSMRANQREARAEMSTAYLGLETHSSAIFQFEAENAEAMEPYRLPKKPMRLPKGGAGQKVTEQLYFQSLNLFEVAANFRKQGIVDHTVFASWVAWFYELNSDWYFREIWDDIRANYTPDVRSIFDAGMLVFDAPDLSDEERLRAFYFGVSNALGGCAVVETWLETSKDRSKERDWFASYLKAQRKAA